MKLTRIATAAALVFAAGHAGAATQGELSDTESTATSVIRIIKENSVQITNVDDINFFGADTGGIAPAVNATNSVESDDVCVFSSTGGYTIEASSTTGFDLTSAGTADTVGYDVSWTAIDTSGAATGTEEDLATGGTAVGTAPGFTGNDTDTDCGADGDNARFTVALNQTDFNDADPGDYSDVLTLTVRPN